MYTKTFEGKKIRISNYHHKSLLKRFDKSNFKPIKKVDRFFLPQTDQMQNTTPCPLCKLFNGCNKCPFGTFSKSGYPGCHSVLDALLSHQNVINTYVDSVVYLIPNETQASKELKIVTDFLKSFKKE